MATKRIVATEVAVVEGKNDNVVGFGLTTADDAARFAVSLGVQLSGTVDERADTAAEHMNRSQRHMLAAGVLLMSLKRDCEHGQFAQLLVQRGFEDRAAQRAMQFAGFVLSRPEGERDRLVNMPKSKVLALAGADPEVIEALLADRDACSVDALSVRDLRQRIADLEAATTDLTVQRDTAEAEAEGLRKQVKRGLPDRQDGVPLVVADLRAEIVVLGKKASLALDGFHALASDLQALVGTDSAHEWAHATLCLAVAQLSALAVQLNGELRYYASARPDEDLTPVPHSYLTKAEVVEAAKACAELTQVHDYERALREWEREQQRPKGKGRPKAKPAAPEGAAS